MTKIKIVSVNLSEKKGTIKSPVREIELFEHGVRKDAHAGDWHRQVSLLGIESIEKFGEKANREFKFGEFAENITTKGIELYKTHPMDIFYNENVRMEVTQIGKKCHGDGCAIFREVGNCVMPKEGIFCKVIDGGVLKDGDALIYEPRQYKALVITLSDRASKGIYEDLSGKAIVKKIKDHFAEKDKPLSINKELIPDDAEKLSSLIENAVNNYDVVITTGGTGIGPKDITVDTVKPLLEKEIPGIMEMIRVKYGMEKPNALLTRAICGTIGKTLIYTLPGSVKGANEYMTEINKTLDHAIYMLHGVDAH
jgi:molybdopterin adenylyltransferase